MNAPVIDIVTPVRDTVSANEWATRVNLAACYRLVAHFGWDLPAAEPRSNDRIRRCPAVSVAAFSTASSARLHDCDA